jgi:hypothetical protein
MSPKSGVRWPKPVCPAALSNAASAAPAPVAIDDDDDPATNPLSLDPAACDGPLASEPFVLAPAVAATFGGFVGSPGRHRRGSKNFRRLAGSRG